MVHAAQALCNLHCGAHRHRQSDRPSPWPPAGQAKLPRRHQEEEREYYDVPVVAQRLDGEREIEREVARLGIHAEPAARGKIEQAQYHEYGIGPPRTSQSEDGERQEDQCPEQLHVSPLARGTIERTELLTSSGNSCG